MLYHDRDDAREMNNITTSTSGPVFAFRRLILFSDKVLGRNPVCAHSQLLFTNLQILVPDEFTFYEELLLDDVSVEDIISPWLSPIFKITLNQISKYVSQNIARLFEYPRWDDSEKNGLLPGTYFRA